MTSSEWVNVSEVDYDMVRANGIMDSRGTVVWRVEVPTLSGVYGYPIRAAYIVASNRKHIKFDGFDGASFFRPCGKLPSSVHGEVKEPAK